eukprot:TRINITY_DN106531_c0_g1_i1.p1 TRINITY_DN106531_c0_g1~~TRINITY_DN106531_c0_g1_i1.p1  ORF type:complete len:309 (+),score=43.70 TRINITY_DN106531_c0_g1_i1:62-928(+)
MASNVHGLPCLLTIVQVISAATSGAPAFSAVQLQRRGSATSCVHAPCTSSGGLMSWSSCSNFFMCCTAALCSGAAFALRGRTQGSGRRASRAEWNSRCDKADGRAVFDLRVTKPLGVEMQEFPDRPGAGIAQVMQGGGVDALNNRALLDHESSMWALEGDEVIAVNGSPCEGAELDAIVALIAGSEGSEVTLTLARNYLKTPKGPVKVVFLPSGKMATVGRRKPLSEVAEFAEEDVNYACKEGWCGTCWHREQCTGDLFKPCCGEVPPSWDNVMPVTLVAEPQSKAAE